MKWTAAQKAIVSITAAVCLILALVTTWALGRAGAVGRPSRATVDVTAGYGHEGLRVSGTAVVRAAPDLAIVTLGYESRNRQAREAKSDNDRVMRRVLAALRTQGIRPADIQTVEYRVFPLLEEVRPKVHVCIWHVRHMVEVHVPNVDKTADVIDAASQAGADNVSDVQFSVEQLHKLRARAREMAAKVAREKAEQLARLMDVRLGRAVSVVDSSSYGGWGTANTQMAAQVPGSATGPESIVSGGQVAVEAREELVFTLE